MRLFTPLALTASLLLALSACGGGSSSSDGDNGAGNPSDFSPVSITSENADDVAGMAISMYDLGLVSSQAADSARSMNGAKSSLQSKAKLFELACEEGGTTTFNGGDGDDDIEAGDYFELVENGCKTQENDDETGESYINTSDGPLRIDVTRVTNDMDIGYKMTLDKSFSTSHGHTGSIKGSGTFDIKYNGDGNLSASGEYNMTATFDGKSISFNPMQYTMDVVNEQYTYNYNAEIYGTAIQGSISIDTSPSFTGSIDDDYPTSGTLTITGSNSSVELNADTGNDDTVLMTINENGSTSSKEVSWESLDDPEPL